MSHIFFADDLLLFGEASFSQACKMEFLLAELCGIFGQRVNLDKPRLWFSPDTPCYLQNSTLASLASLYSMGGPLKSLNSW